MNRIVLIVALMGLTACSQSPSAVRITQDQPELKPVPMIKARSEPVFYNGKTYQVALSPNGSGITSISISGMSDKQSKDADGLGSSAFQHFACRESQRAHIVSQPAYADGSWSLSARCS
jgi:hypothetical protein